MGLFFNTLASLKRKNAVANTIVLNSNTINTTQTTTTGKLLSTSLKDRVVNPNTSGTIILG